MTRPRVLVMAPRAPLPVRNGANLRVLQHLAVLRRAGWDVHLFVLDATSWDPRAGNAERATCHLATDPSVALLQGTDDPARLQWITTGANPFAAAATPTVRADLQAALETVDPHLVLVSGHEMTALLPDARHRDAPLILDLHNVLDQVIGDVGTLDAGHRARALLHRQAAAAASPIEAELLRHADQVWACSDEDADRLRAHGSGVPIVAVPNTVDLQHYDAPEPAPEPRVILTALFRYPPNERAALELIDALDHLPGVSLDLVGAEVPASLVERAAGDHRVTLTGPVPDVRPYLRRAWVAAMPLRAGSGTRLKVGEAAAARIPIVATAKAVEGIPMTPDVHYVRAESPDETITAIASLLADRPRRESLAEAAHALAATHLSWEAAERAAVPAIEAVRSPGTVR